jgi:lambda repressor-like predicted transcriptional regulator
MSALALAKEAGVSQQPLSSCARRRWEVQRRLLPKRDGV